MLLFPQKGAAQNDSRSYELLPAPDLWYNDVDGIRVGLRLRGQMPGTFEDGPHRLDLGAWLGTWLPDDPVSYYVSFTEPIPAISDFANEGSVRLTSSIRTGLHRHGVSFQKRWQQGFNEKDYRNVQAGFLFQKRYDSEYVQFPALWQNESLFLGTIQFIHSKTISTGRIRSRLALNTNLAGPADRFAILAGESEYRLPLGNLFRLNSRLFVQAGSEGISPEFQLPRSFGPAVGWADRGLTRAKGTIPVSWINAGRMQVAGGANMRGYIRQDIDQLNAGNLQLYDSFGAVNLELDYPNPVNTLIENIPVVGGVLEMRSYLFLDGGTSFSDTGSNDATMADAGTGFTLSLNIPDYLDNDRGFRIRYDIPWWLSDPADGERSFKFRSVIGLGAVIAL